MSTSKELREKALGRKSNRKPVVGATVDGVTYYVKPATVRERGEILRRGGIRPVEGGSAEIRDLAAFQTCAVCLLACDENGNRVFDDTDFDALLGEEVGGIVDQLAGAATSQINVDPKEIAKN
jgi:hypothetical protein